MEINVNQNVPPDFDERLKVVEKKLDANNLATAEILQLVSTFKGGMQFLGWLGVAAKWVASVGAAVGAVYAAVHWWGGAK